MELSTNIEIGLLSLAFVQVRSLLTELYPDGPAITGEGGKQEFNRLWNIQSELTRRILDLDESGYKDCKENASSGEKENPYVDAIRTILIRCKENRLPVDIYTRLPGLFRGYVIEIPEKDTGVVLLTMREPSENESPGSCIILDQILCVISESQKR